MSRLVPVSRNDLLRRLGKLGFENPGTTGVVVSFGPKPYTRSKKLCIYSTYNFSMRGNTNIKYASATSRIPVSRDVWASLSSLRKPGETYNDLLEEMIEREKKRRLFEDMDRIEKRGKFMAMKW